MFKTIVTLIRGAGFRAEEELADRTALLVLDQQIRDAAAGIERAKRALAVAIAQDEAEGKRLETTLGRIADLEDRALAALNGRREDLATEAAEAIAVMEADRDAIRQARESFAREIAALKASVRTSSQRLAELERHRPVRQAAVRVVDPAVRDPERGRAVGGRQRDGADPVVGRDLLAVVEDDAAHIRTTPVSTSTWT